MKQAIYPGTFDPFTIGHLDIVQRALKVFDEVIVAVATSQSKKPMFGVQRRVEMIELATQKIDNVKVESFDTLLVDFAQQKSIYNIVRGLRAVSDFEFELQMGYANASLDSKIETIYFMPNLQNAFVSSSVVRTILSHGGDASHLVPSEILEFINVCDI
jgi:pantetheine-phosphate adenylyltransferase